MYFRFRGFFLLPIFFSAFFPYSTSTQSGFYYIRLFEFLFKVQWMNSDEFVRCVYVCVIIFCDSCLFVFFSLFLPFSISLRISPRNCNSRAIIPEHIQFWLCIETNMTMTPTTIKHIIHVMELFFHTFSSMIFFYLEAFSFFSLLHSFSLFLLIHTPKWDIRIHVATEILCSSTERQWRFCFSLILIRFTSICSNKNIHFSNIFLWQM